MTDQEQEDQLTAMADTHAQRMLRMRNGFMNGGTDGVLADRRNELAAAIKALGGGDTDNDLSGAAPGAGDAGAANQPVSK